MNVYILNADCNKYQGAIVRFGDTDKFVHSFKGFPINGPLPRVIVRWDPDMFRYPKGDFPLLSTHIPVFSEKAVIALLDLLEGNGELIPVKIGRETYHLFNVTRLIDDLDETRSDILRFEGTNRIIVINVHRFRGERLKNATIFKIPQDPMMDVFVTDTFVERVQSAGLKGFKFELAWSDEPGYVPKPRSLF